MHDKYWNNPVKYGSGKWWLWQLSMLALLVFTAFLGRLGFVLRNFDFNEILSYELLQAFWYGLRLDLSISSYVLLIINVFVFLLCFKSWPKKAFNFLISALFIVLVLLYLFDAELYSYWGFKIDKSVLKYLSTPKEAAASVSIYAIFLLTLVLTLFSAILIWFYQRFMAIDRLVFSGYKSLIALVILPVLFLLGRGSIDVAGVNESSAYFSQNPKLNHTAVNGAWNFFSSVVNPQRGTGLVWSDTLAHRLDFFASPCAEPQQLFKTENTNIVIVILESFSANLFNLGDTLPDPIPNLRKIAAEGYFYLNGYAAGNRSDKGLSAIFTGYPSHPYGSIMKYPHKFDRISRLVAPFNQQGYHSAFYYGGNADFANFRGLLVSSGFQKIVAQENFPRRSRTSKWGIHDHIVMERLWEDMQTAKQPFFFSVFTLSSHEPFDVPFRSVFLNNSPLGKYLNSIAFTDSVIGDFYQKIKNSPLWDNTLLVFLADHGHYFPLLRTHEYPEHHRIPIILTGGALSGEWAGRVNPKMVSQSDLPYSLLTAFGFSSPVPFPLERNIFCKDYNAPIGYIFNYGYGVFTPDGEELIYDFAGSFWIRKKIKSDQSIMAADAWFRYIVDLYER